MVGTSSTSVTRSFCIAAITPSGVKAGMMTLEPPLEQQRIHRRAVGEMEHRRGVQIDRRAPETVPSPSAFSALAIRLPWLSITPFERPVVPPV